MRKEKEALKNTTTNVGTNCVRPSKHNDEKFIINKKIHVGAGLVPTQKGITLVALVITIIVMLILAGVAISALVGDGRNNLKSTKCIGNI